MAGLVLVNSPHSLQGRPPFADEVDRLCDPVDQVRVRASLAWFPRFHPVPDWYLEDRVRDRVRTPAHVWRETFNGPCEATPPSDLGSITSPTLILWGNSDELLAREQKMIPPVPFLAHEWSSTKEPATSSSGNNPTRWLLT